MRKVATATRPGTEFHRVMIYDPEDAGGGVFVFLFRSLDDGPCDADYFYEDVKEAEQCAAEAIGVGFADWQAIADPQPGCFHDRLATVRIVRDSEGPP